MTISGPHLDESRRTSPKKWYLSYFAPETLEGGAVKVVDGRAVLKRFRPYYETKELAQADKPRIIAQHGAAGTGAAGVLTREELEDLEAARREVPRVSMVELAKFWRLHHPLRDPETIAQLAPKFLEWVKARLGETRHYEDLKARVTYFAKTFGGRDPATFAKAEFLRWLLELGCEPRTVLNYKRAVVNFFNWLATDGGVLEINPLAGIKRRQLPKGTPKEIEFLELAEVERYLRALEQFDPELIAHEIIQLFAGVRADDEMADFDGKWVLPQTRQIVIPAEIAKTGRREVIDALEENFWPWWKRYGRAGILRPKNYRKRWMRVRVLSTLEDDAAAELAALPVLTLLKRPEGKLGLKAWPWNARRRTFCTYKVAKDQSAAAAALILRHRGDATTLHNSYRGTGITQKQGRAFFALLPGRLYPD